MRWIKRRLRGLQEYAERRFLGGALQAVLWRYRHLYKRGWAEGYLNTVDHPHRPQLVDAVAAFDLVESVMEIGCASGANLICLRARFPSASLVGLDINAKAIKVARQHFLDNGDQHVRLIIGEADNLKAISDNSIDIVVTDAVLMFVTPDRIRAVLAEMTRVASKGLVFNEFHSDGEKNGCFYGGRWIYDLVSLIELEVPSAVISKKKSAFVGGAWDAYGTLVVVRF